MNDLDKELVGVTTKNEKVYHVLNNGNVPYTVIEDAEGREIYSCERARERSMFKYLKIKLKGE